MKSLRGTVFAFSLGAILACALLCAQAPLFRASVEVVAVNVLVTERGKPVAGLRADDFQVWDDGVPQSVKLTASSEGVNVVLVLDTSGSVTGAMLSHLTTAGRALVSALSPQDRLSLITFSERIRKSPDTVRREAVLTQLEQLKAGGRTALYDAVYTGLSLASKNMVGRSLLLVFTDGLDNASWLQSDELLGALQRGNSVMYAVARRELRTPLEEMTAKTGGELLAANADKHLAIAFVKILERFRAGYLLTYSPDGVRHGDGWHELRVRLRHRSGEVKARPGYYSR